MKLAKIQNNQVIKFPYTEQDFRNDNPNVSFPINLEGVDLSTFDVHEIKESKRPTIDHTEHLEHGEIKKIKGVWTQTWNVVKLVEQDISARIDSTFKSYENMLSLEFHKLAERMGYESFYSLASWAHSSVDKYRAEALAALELRDDVFIAFYKYQDDVKSGIKKLESDFESLKKHLPKIEL